MKLSSLVAIATSTALTLFSAVEAQQPISGYTPVTGPTTGGVAQRMPLQSMSPDVYNMFVLALISMQNKPESDSLSYYQLSGIHGIPFIPWQETSVSTQDPTRGYCTHNTPLFATWHRPFLSLFEQRLVKHAEYEASKFKGSEAARWKKAASLVRLPYWDWAATDLQSRQPRQLTAQTVSVRRAGTGGVPQTVSVANPLREYRFRDNARRASTFSNQFATSAFTRRQPPSNAMSSSDFAEVDSVMNEQYASRRRQTLGLFSIANFGQFASTQQSASGAPNSFNSIESIHNLVHVSVGGEWGHMTAVPYSAFDPIFWLHHCNVDRLIAMYQAVYPGRRITSAPPAGTFARRVTSRTPNDNMQTPLQPFRHAGGSYFTSQDVSAATDIWKFGYAYPEVPYEYSTKVSQLPAFAMSRVNALYRDSTSRKRASGETRREWICHMAFDASEVEGSCEIQVHFTKPNSLSPAPPFGSNSTSFLGSNSTVGMQTGKEGQYVGSCASFRDATTQHIMKMDITGAVYMSDSLLEAGCKSLEPKDVVPYLKENIKWVVKKAGGEEVSLDQLPSLKVAVSSAEVTYPEDDTKPPVYGEFETHYDVTDNKKCGFTYSDEHLVDSKPAPPVASDGKEEPVPVEEPKPTSAPCSTEVSGGITTIHVTSYTTVCPTSSCGAPIAFTSLYPTATLPPYSVY